jgi:hypothetical protein
MENFVNAELLQIAQHGQQPAAQYHPGGAPAPYMLGTLIALSERKNLQLFAM